MHELTVIENAEQITIRGTLSSLRALHNVLTRALMAGPDQSEHEAETPAGNRVRIERLEDPEGGQ